MLVDSSARDLLAVSDSMFTTSGKFSTLHWREYLIVSQSLMSERSSDPTLNPAPGCTNPDPTTNIKCTLFSQPPTQANITNAGQWRQQFQVVIAGSNGYAKLGSVPVGTQDYGVNQSN